MGEIIFNSVSSKDIGVEIETFPDYAIPEKNVEVFDIPGRNGSLIIDHGTFKNIDLSYKFSIVAKNKDYSMTMHKLASWLYSCSGYARLEDTYDKECYRMARCSSSMSINNLFDQAGQGTLTFNCKPQRFLKVGDKEIVGNKYVTDILSFHNPTSFESTPIIKFHDIGLNDGSETGKIMVLSINGKEINVDFPEDIYSTKKDITIDFDTQMVMSYDQTTHKTAYITDASIIPFFENPVRLLKDKNSIGYSANGKAYVTVIPRWWTI